MGKLWVRSLEQKRHLVLSISSPNFVEPKGLFLLLTCYPVGNTMGRGPRKAPFHWPPSVFARGVWLHQKSCSFASYKKQRVNCHSYLCSRTLVEGKREFCLSNSSGVFKDLKLPSFYCYELSSQSWLGGSPILKQVVTSCINTAPSFRLWAPWITFPLRQESRVESLVNGRNMESSREPGWWQ